MIYVLSFETETHVRVKDNQLFVPKTINASCLRETTTFFSDTNLSMIYLIYLIFEKHLIFIPYSLI